MIPQSFQKRINNELAAFFTHKKHVSQHPQIKELVSQIESVTLRGGDRLRPYMCALGYEAVVGKIEQERLLPVFLSLELTHSYFLIHDDIMDEASLRRGDVTIHAHFTQNLRNAHLGDSLAILAGDLVAAWAEELWYPLLLSDQGRKAWKLFNQMKEEVILGQTLDVWGMKSATSQDLLAMYEAKSGNYSVEKPLLVGAILGGASEKMLAYLSLYGKSVGLAFQFKDDWLGLFGHESLTGKSVSGDIQEGKWTIFISKTYEKLSSADKQKLCSILGNAHVTEQEVEWVRLRVEQSGAKLEVETLMRQLVSQALRSLKTQKIQHKAKLEEVAHFLVERSQ